MKLIQRSNNNEDNIIIKTILCLKDSFWHCLIFSSIINILSLALPIYSMQVLDRVLNSSSIETLIYLSLIIFISLIVMNFLINVRDYAFSFIANSFEKKLFNITFSHNIRDSVKSNIGSQYLKDLAQIKSFITSPNLPFIFDVPWVIIFLAVIFYIHWILGFVILGSAFILAFMAFLNQKILRADTEKLSEMQIAVNRSLELLTRNSEIIIGMGMTENVNNKYNQNLLELKDLENKIRKKTKSISIIVKNLRYFMQMMVTFISALLIIKGKMSSGGMIAVSTLAGKVLAPFDASASIFQALVYLKKSYQRLKNSFQNISTEQRIELPEPKGNIIFDGVTFIPQGSNLPTIKNISFKVDAGQVVGVIGKSGSGKTTIARLLTNVFEPNRGNVLIDSAPLKLWNESQIGKHIGYVPQDIELFYANIKDNISRFSKDAKDADIILAAQMAGIHELILSLPRGYETLIDQTNISAGQRQRIALARALFGSPKVLVLDEPNSNLDIEGENALVKIIEQVKFEKNMTIFIISHKPSILKFTDKILIIDNGELKSFEESAKIINEFSTK
jgi:PrtD family type I secretion system ABC transporter